MSFKTSLVKMAVSWTPKILVEWVTNILLKGIVELVDYSIDLDARKAYAQILLYGEAEPIEVWLEGFAIINDGESKTLIIEQAQSNRLWLSNILSRIVGKAWSIPVIPQFTAQIELIAELLKPETPVDEAN